MILVKMIFAFLFPTLLGYILVELVAPKGGLLKPLEKLAVSYCMGVGILTFVMFLLGAFGLPMNLASIIIACSLLFIIPLIMVARNMAAPRFDVAGLVSGLKGLKWYEWLFACLILFRICFSYFSALIKPIGDVDAFANWSLRAKAFFVTQGLSLGKLHGYFVGGGQLNYPINIPLFETWIYNVLGAWNDLLVKAIFPTFLLALVIIFYYSMRRAYGRAFSLFSAYLLTTLPLLIYHSSSAYTDFPLSVYFSISVFYLVNYLESRDKRHLIISALLAGMGAWTKSEGFYLVLISTAVLALSFIVQKKDPKSIIGGSLFYALIGLIFKIAWSLFNVFYRVPKEGWQTIEYAKAIEYLYRLPVIFERFYKRFFFYGNWNIAWFMFVVMLIIMLLRSINNPVKPRQLYSLLICLLCLLAFVMIYYLTPNYTWLLDGTTVNRNTLLVMPIVIFFVSSGIGEVLGKSQ
jgi:Dolichyl-phosphate-mannose-protein mannosyltransferase